LSSRRGKEEEFRAPKQYPFVAVVGKNSWRIETGFIIGGEDKWFFDGTNVYSSLRASNRSWSAVADRVRRAPSLEKATDAMMPQIRITVYPSQDGHPMGHKIVNLA